MSTTEQPTKGSPPELAEEVNSLLNRVARLEGLTAGPVFQPHQYHGAACFQRHRAIHGKGDGFDEAYVQQDLLPSPVEPGFTEPAAANVPIAQTDSGPDPSDYVPDTYQTITQHIDARSLACQILEELDPGWGLGSQLYIANVAVYTTEYPDLDEPSEPCYLSTRLVDLLSQWAQLPRSARRG